MTCLQYLFMVCTIKTDLILNISAACKMCQQAHSERKDRTESCLLWIPIVQPAPGGKGLLCIHRSKSVGVNNNEACRKPREPSDRMSHLNFR